MVQTDASSNGTGLVYTRDVPHLVLRRECMRPRTEPRDPDNRWEVEKALAIEFDAPLDPSSWHVAVRRRLRGPARKAHINDKELGVTADAVRWTIRSPGTRRCRLVLQSDSTAAVGALRKGRSSKRPLLRHCRRLAALTLAEQVALEARWIQPQKTLRMVRHVAAGPLLVVMISTGFTRDCDYRGGNVKRSVASWRRCSGGNWWQILRSH